MECRECRHSSVLLSEPLKFTSKGFKILSAFFERIFQQAPCQRLSSTGRGGVADKKVLCPNLADNQNTTLVFGQLQSSY